MNTPFATNLRFAESRYEVPRSNRSSETSNRIVTAGILAFSNRGFSNTSTRDIASLAGVNQGLITYHFGSKEHLWKVAMDRLFGDFRNGLADRMHELRDVDVPTYLRLILREFVRFSAHSPYVVRLMTEEAKTPTKRLDWLVDRHIKPVYQAVTGLLLAGQQAGALRPGPVVNIYYHFVGSSLVFALPDEVRRVSGADVASSAFIDAHADCLLAMLMEKSTARSLKPASPARKRRID